MSIGDTAEAAGQVMVEVNAGSAAPAGVSVCAQLSVDVVAAACGVQLRPIAGALAPTVAGELIVRFAPAVIAKAAVPAGIVQANATLAVATPAVATVTAAVPVPPVSVTAAGNGLSVGAAGVTVPAGQVKPQIRLTPMPEILRGGARLAANSMHVNVAVPAVAARVQSKLIVPAIVVYIPFAGVVVTAPKVAPPAAPEIAQDVTKAAPPPLEPVGVTEIVVVVAPTAPDGKVTVVSAGFGAGAKVSVGDTTGAAGQVIVDVNGANAAPAGTAVCAQLRMPLCTAAAGVQLTPMAGALAPKVAGAAIVRVPPEVTVKPAVALQTKPKLPGGAIVPTTPAVATLIATVAVPPVSVVAAKADTVGATPVVPPPVICPLVTMQG